MAYMVKTFELLMEKKHCSQFRWAWSRHITT